MTTPGEIEVIKELCNMVAKYDVSQFEQPLPEFTEFKDEKMRDYILKILGIDKKIDEAHNIKDDAQSKLGQLELERRRINQAVLIIRKATKEQDRIINDIARRIAMATPGGKNL